MAVSHVGSNTLGNLLKIVSKNGVFNNFSEDSSVWQNILKKYVAGDSKGRQLRYAVRSTLGSGAVGFIAAAAGDYKQGREASVSEGIAEWKDYSATIEVDQTVLRKAMQDFDSYGRPLIEELELKSIALSRVLSASVYGDGTGVIAQALDAGSVSADTVPRTVFNVQTASSALGFIGWVEEGDILHAINPDGSDASPTVSSGTYHHYRVMSIDKSAGTISLQAESSADAALDVTATGITAGDYLVRGTTADTFQALDSIGSSDYNGLSFNFTGLGSLSENDGRVVNNITLSGNLGGTRRDASGNPLDVQDFQKLLSDLMRRAGKGRYSYSQALMSWDAYDALVESREVDRRFQTVEDKKRGVSGMGYQHGRNAVMFEADEFCPDQRIYLIPDKGVLQFHGTDFDFVTPNAGQKFHLKPASSGGTYSRSIQSFMEGSGALISVHNAAIGCIENFSV